MVTSEVVKLGERAALLQPADNVHAPLPDSAVNTPRINDLLHKHLQIGDKKDVLILSADMAERTMLLFLKAKDRLEQDRAIRAHKKSEAAYAKSQSTACGEMPRHTIAAPDSKKQSACPATLSGTVASSSNAAAEKTLATPDGAGKTAADAKIADASGKSYPVSR